jgi:hypothetical protein
MRERKAFAISLKDDLAITVSMQMLRRVIALRLMRIISRRCVLYVRFLMAQKKLEMVDFGCSMIFANTVS